MSLQPIKCKVCGQIIPEPPRIIGEAFNLHIGKCVMLMTRHLLGLAEQEAMGKPNGTLRTPHAEALGRVLRISESFKNYLAAANFEMPEEMARAGDEVRKEVHRATGRTRFTDEELEAKASSPGVAAVLRELRDRYEELG